MKTFTVVVRRVKKTQALELFFINTNESDKTFWIEGYAPNDGHFQTTRGYIRKETEFVRETYAKAVKLVKAWDQLPGCVGFTARIGTRLNGPRGYYYCGE